jgi:hypothetical protein
LSVRDCEFPRFTSGYVNVSRFNKPSRYLICNVDREITTFAGCDFLAVSLARRVFIEWVFTELQCILAIFKKRRFSMVEWLNRKFPE